MVFSLAPNISKSGSAKDSNSTVSTSAVITSIVRQFPMMRSDFSLSPAPSAIEARGAPPMAMSDANAEMTMMIGRHTPTPVSASFPTVSAGCIWPMNTRSTRL